MPRATIDIEETFRYDLRTLPANNGSMGGFVILRRLSYHQMMQRRDIAAKIGWEEKQTTGRRNNRNKPEEQTIKAMMEVMNVATMEYEFKHSIVDHNLEDSNGNLLDFTNPESFRNLHPKIGAEIGEYIDDLNQEADEAELENFPIASKRSSGEEMTQPITSEES
jgi:hypothetical protein